MAKKLAKLGYFEDNFDSCNLVYEDDGIGIPKFEKEKIFGKGYGRGTGLGLCMIKIMCNIYGWNARALQFCSFVGSSLFV